MLKYGFLNYEWLSSYCDPNIDSILSDLVVPNLYGLDINNDLVLDPQAIDDLDSVEEYLKYNEDIQDIDPIIPNIGK